MKVFSRQKKGVRLSMAVMTVPVPVESLGMYASLYACVEGKGVFVHVWCMYPHLCVECRPAVYPGLVVGEESVAQQKGAEAKWPVVDVVR